MLSEKVVDEAVNNIRRDFLTRVKDPLGTSIIDHGEFKFKKGDHWTYYDAQDFAKHLADAVRTYSDKEFNGKYKTDIDKYVLLMAKTGGTHQAAYPDASS